MSRKNRFICILSIVSIIALCTIGYLVEKVKVNNGTKKVIDVAIKNSKINKYIVDYTTNGKINLDVSIKVNDEFEKVYDSNEKILDVMDSLHYKIMYPIYKKYRGEFGQGDLSRRLAITTSKGTYEFYDRDGELTLPSGEKYSKNTSSDTNSTFDIETSTDTTYSTPREPSEDNKGFAWTAAKKVVKENLKAPSTADFPFSYARENITEIGTNTFVVKSYVDSENGFGAKIRSNFTITIIKNDENSYTYKNLSISS